MQDHITLLKNEFSGGEGTFIFTLRFKTKWDREMFNRLIVAMYTYCHENEGKEVIERWATGGFHMCMDAVPRWIDHSNFIRNYSDAYYEKALQFLDELHCHLCNDRDLFFVRYDSVDEPIAELNELK